VVPNSYSFTTSRIETIEFMRGSVAQPVRCRMKKPEESSEESRSEVAR
jgi:hypothetical protein